MSPLLRNLLFEEDISGDDRDILPDKQHPDNFILKDSWPLVGRDCEAQMFGEVKGDFGVPSVITSYFVNEGKEMTTDMDMPEDAKYWDIFNLKPKLAPKPELRRHMRTLFDTEGVPLSTLKAPKELLRTVCHAILGKNPSAFLISFLTEEPLSPGHWNLFKKGWLHRDVSIGNVMRLKTPEKRKPVTE